MARSNNGRRGLCTLGAGAAPASRASAATPATSAKRQPMETAVRSLGSTYLSTLPLLLQRFSARFGRFGHNRPLRRHRRKQRRNSCRSFEGLHTAGLLLAVRIAFPDHHHNRAHDLDCIQEGARSTGATAFVNTERGRTRTGTLTQPSPQPIRRRLPAH
jgi:hypothetical protein